MIVIVRLVCVIMATMAIDILCGLVGGAIAGKEGIRIGVNTTNAICFTVVAILISVNGWRGAWAIITETFKEKNRHRRGSAVLNP